MPGIVTRLTTVVLSVNAIQVSWDEPIKSNGRLQSYLVVVRRREGEIANIAVDPDGIRVVHVAELGTCISIDTFTRYCTL